jgi:GT2 family glycosyltransferase
MKVSVLIITHDRPADLSLTLSGITAQSHRPDEVIVIDNGSKTSCETVIAKYQTALPLLYEWINERFIAAARNYAIEKSKGDIVIFTDDDCVPEPDWIAGMVVPFMNDASVGEVGGKVITYQTKLNTITLVGDSMYRFMMKNYEKGMDCLDTEVPYRSFFATANAGFRRSVLSSLGGFDPSLSFAEDIDLSFRIIRAGWRLAYNPEAVIRHKHRETLQGVLHQFWMYGSMHPIVFKKFNQVPGKLTIRYRTGFRDRTRGSFRTVHVPCFINGCICLHGLVGLCIIYSILLLTVIFGFSINGFLGITLALVFALVFLGRIYVHHVGLLKLRFINIPLFLLETIARALITLSAFLRGIKMGILFIN